MDLLIPANGIFQPFLLGESERRFNLRAHVGFADPLVEICHEHDRRNLIEQHAIPRFERGDWTAAVSRWFRAAGRGLKEYAGEPGENFFRGSDIQRIKRW